MNYVDVRLEYDAPVALSHPQSVSFQPIVPSPRCDLNLTGPGIIILLHLGPWTM